MRVPLAFSWFKTMPYVSEAFARIVAGLPRVDDKQIGWTHGLRQQSTNCTLDFWYLGTSRQNVEQEVANATFIGSNGVEMPILFKKVFDIGSLGVNGVIVEVQQCLGWVEVFSILEGPCFHYASQALVPMSQLPNDR